MSILTLYIAKNIFNTLETQMNIQISLILFNLFIHIMSILYDKLT